LVPTTLLAEQHGKTFRERFAGLPVRIGVLSRFTPEKEEKSILEGLEKGTLDIVIGTHRLLQPDVRFKDLGLLIVDEEHRFGVAQKERIRELKAEVDTLYLSATPIPRTLYSALVGLKDLSSIKTPPPGRKPIRTFLAPFDPLLVREAILFELERGGKVFYVHDRVASIEARRRYLENLVPEARIGVVHGQMPEGLVEETMLLFAEGAYDVLLATTIIESGLDVGEANTILIERADRLGLATLYQLRGRVGRREQEAYAYLFHPPRLTEAAEKRLNAIADLSDLGSGHLLAEKDMEIRGVGNLLGPEQHGHIRALSLVVYRDLLDEAIRKLKGEAKEERRHVTLDLGVSARLPAEYVPSLEGRSRYYGRLAEARSLAEASRIARELKDRYGPLPEEAENFLALARLRLVAERKGVVSITEDLTHLQVVFPRWPLDYDAKALRQLPFRVELTQYPPGFRLEKKGLKPRDYPEALLQALYLFADI
jgi:transcription-repair coupling factor (superfamily II helicase)